MKYEQEDQFLDEVDEAAIDAIEDVRDGLLNKFQSAMGEMTRPSIMFRPALTKTATAWKATYGEFQVFGNTPDVAMKNFDHAWLRRLINVQ